MASQTDRVLVWACAIVPAKMGSFERLCIRMAEQARLAGVLMQFVFLGEPALAVGEELRRAGASWVVVPGLVDLRGQSARAMVRLLQSTGPSLSHFHYCSGISPLYPRLSAAGHLSVFTYHMSGEAAISSGLKRTVKHLRHTATTSFVDGFTAVSGWSRHKLSTDYLIPESRIRLIYNGVEVGEAPAGPVDYPARRLLVVAALIPEKGVDTAIRALGHIRGDHPEATLTIVGVGPERAALERLAVDEGVSDAISWLGLRDDVPRLMAEHDVVLVPSRWAEAFGLTLAESMAAGRPVIASKVGGIPELITDGVNGLLVTPGDAAAWARAISRVLSDRTLYAALASSGHATALQRFNLKDNVARYWDLYRALDPWAFSETLGESS